MITERFYLKPKGSEEKIYIKIESGSSLYMNNREAILEALREIGELEKG